MGISSSVPSFFTTSWHGALLTVFGIRSLRRPSIGSIFSVSSMPADIFGLVSSSISRARSSSDLTPSAMHMRFIDPYRLIATGMSKPAGFSNSSAGPPPGDFETLSVTAQISRFGLTGSLIRASSRFLSSASMKAFRSLNIVRLSLRHRSYRRPGDFSLSSLNSWPSCSKTLHLVSDRLRQRERLATGFAVYERLALLANRADEVAQLPLQRLLADDRQLASLNLRALPVAAQQPIALDFLLRIVDRHVRVRLEEADLADALLADPARGHVRDAAGRESQPGVRDVVLVGQHRHAHRFYRDRLGFHQCEDDVEVVDHQVEHDVNVQAPIRKHPEAMHLNESRRRHERHHRRDCGVVAFRVANGERGARCRGCGEKRVSFRDRARDRLFDEHGDAPIQKGQRDLVVQFGGRGDRYRIHVVDHFAIIGNGPGARWSRSRRRALGVRIDDRHELGAIQLAENARMMFPEVPDADDRDAQSRISHAASPGGR